MVQNLISFSNVRTIYIQLSVPKQGDDLFSYKLNYKWLNKKIIVQRDPKYY